MVEHGAVEILISLIENSTVIEVAENAIWVLGNISSDVKHIELIISCNAPSIILNLLSKASIDSYFTNISVWVLTNLCKGKPKPDYKKLKPIIPVFLSILLKVN